MADEIVRQLTGACERVEIGGHLRRKNRKEVDRVEILLVPRFENRRLGVFGRQDVSLAEEKLTWLLNSGFFYKRADAKGHYAWGNFNKSATHRATGVAVEVCVVKLSEMDELLAV